MWPPWTKQRDMKDKRQYPWQGNEVDLQTRNCVTGREERKLPAENLKP